MASNNNADWRAIEKRQQWNTNCNGLRINNPTLKDEKIYETAQKQVNKGFELFPDNEPKVAKKEKLEDII